MTSAYPQLSRKGLPTSYCYLAQDGESGKKYIVIISGGNQFGSTIKVGGASKELLIDNKVKFIEVSDTLLNLGITLLVVNLFVLHHLIKKLAFDSAANAFAINVFPQPGGPNSKIPL
jgi:hypothetical protein